MSGRNTHPLIDGGDVFLGIFPYDSEYMIKFTDKWITWIVCGSILIAVPCLLFGQFEIARTVFQCTKFLSVWSVGSLLIDICLSIYSTFENILSSIVPSTNGPIGIVPNSQASDQNLNSTQLSPSNPSSASVDPTPDSLPPNIKAETYSRNLGPQNNNVIADTSVNAILAESSSQGVSNPCRPSKITSLRKKQKLIGLSLNSLKEDCTRTNDSEKYSNLPTTDKTPATSRVSPPPTSTDTSIPNATRADAEDKFRLITTPNSKIDRNIRQRRVKK